MSKLVFIRNYKHIDCHILHSSSPYLYLYVGMSYITKHSNLRT